MNIHSLRKKIKNLFALDIEEIKSISDTSETMSFDSSYSTTVSQAGFSPAQAVILTGIATGIVYSATKQHSTKSD